MKTMKEWLYRAGMGMAAVVVVASVMALATPKAAHAVVSALVTVANTATNPVPNRDVDNPARQPFQVEFPVNQTEPAPRQLFGQILVPSTTTTGAPVQELVIEEVNGGCLSGGLGNMTVSVFLNGQQTDFALLGVAGPFGGFIVPTQSVRFYADAGTSSFVTAFGPTGTPTQCQISISGYLVTK